MINYIQQLLPRLRDFSSQLDKKNYSLISFLHYFSQITKSINIRLTVMADCFLQSMERQLKVPGNY